MCIIRSSSTSIKLAQLFTHIFIIVSDDIHTIYILHIIKGTMINFAQYFNSARDVILETIILCTRCTNVGGTDYRSRV